MRPSAQHRAVSNPFRRHIRGFTLVELLVTVGIIALLTAMSLVGLSIVRKNAQRTRVQDDLQMITLALEAYKSDFHDYPRFADPLADQSDLIARPIGNGTWLDYSTDRGARLLCQALIAPGPAGTGSVANPGEDGYDGTGFRIRRTGAGSKVYPAYLATDKFKLEHNPTITNMQDAKILDNTGSPILYFPAMPGPPMIAAPKGLFVSRVDPKSYAIGNIRPFYNSIDNESDSSQLVAGVPKPLLDHNQMALILGDNSSTMPNGMIDNGEVATTTQPYLLWTAGPDGVFGLNSAGKTDDITNFDIPAKFKK